MKKLLFAVSLLFAALQANAQFVPGQVLTAAELNSEFATKAPIPTGTCLGSGFALNYNLGSGAFTCNGTIAAVTLNGNTFQSPGPIGSVSPSTGSFTNLTANGTLTFANGNITLPYLATQAANTVVANVTSGTASPTAASLPSCNAATSALGYANGVGFNCNTAINASTLGGATFTSPGAIGSTAASTGKFTTLQTTGAYTPSSTAGIVGTTTNDNANTGSIGEFVSNSRVAGSAISLTNNTAADITSVSLTAGDWDCRGGIGFTTSAGASGLLGWINNTSVTQPLLSSGFGNTQLIGTSAILGNNLISIMPTRISSASSVTVYLTGAALFSSGTASAFGYLGCRRMR
jgi:hypothetical protein